MGRWDRRVTHLGDGDLNISLVLLNISSKFLLHFECYLLLLEGRVNIHVGGWIKGCIGITGRGDASVAVICHAMSLTVLYVDIPSFPLNVKQIYILLPHVTCCSITVNQTVYHTGLQN